MHVHVHLLLHVGGELIRFELSLNFRSTPKKIATTPQPITTTTALADNIMISRVAFLADGCIVAAVAIVVVAIDCLLC